MATLTFVLLGGLAARQDHTFVRDAAVSRVRVPRMRERHRGPRERGYAERSDGKHPLVATV